MVFSKTRVAHVLAPCFPKHDEHQYILRSCRCPVRICLPYSWPEVAVFDHRHHFPRHVVTTTRSLVILLAA